MTLKLAVATGVATFALAAGAPALAAITISEGTCGCNLSTVHLIDNVVGDDFVNGTILSGAVDVLFSSNEVIMATGGPGQAWVGGADDTTDNLTFSVVGHTFDALEFNINTTNGGGRPTAWGVTITGLDQNNVSYVQDFTGITNNQFFNLAIVANSGEHIQSMSFQIDGATNDSSPIIAAGQFRVGGIDGAVPEPAAWALMIMGFGGIGALLRRRAATASA